MPAIRSFEVVRADRPVEAADVVHDEAAALPRNSACRRELPGAEFTWTTVTAGVRTTARQVVMPRAGGGNGIDLQVDQQGLLTPLVRLLLSRKIRDLLTTEADGLCRAAEAEATPGT